LIVKNRDDRKTKFWTNRWIDGKSIYKELRPNLFMDVRNSLFVSDHFGRAVAIQCFL
jgi:hypothetical protein